MLFLYKNTSIWTRALEYDILLSHEAEILSQRVPTNMKSRIYWLMIDSGCDLIPYTTSLQCVSIADFLLRDFRCLSLSRFLRILQLRWSFERKWRSDFFNPYSRLLFVVEYSIVFLFIDNSRLLSPSVTHSPALSLRIVSGCDRINRPVAQALFRARAELSSLLLSPWFHSYSTSFYSSCYRFRR